MKNKIFIILLLFSIPCYSKSFLFAGDTMIGEEIVSEKIFGDAISTLEEPTDFMFFNFEGTLGNHGVDDKTPKCLFGLFCYKFMINPNNLKIFKNFNSNIVFNLANNHSMDYGSNTQINTKNLIEKTFHSIGTIYSPEHIFEKEKVVFIGASPHSGTFSIFNPELIKKVIFYKNHGYIVVVSLHMGKEGVDEYLVKNQNEIFCGQNRGNIYELSHKLIDNGADIIVGHGPHITRGFELYKNKLIMYSLGNFLTYGQFSLNKELAYSSLFKVNIDDNGDFLSGEIKGFEQTKSKYSNLWVWHSS